MFHTFMNWLRTHVLSMLTTPAAEPGTQVSTPEQRLAQVLITSLIEAMQKEAETGDDAALKLRLRLAEIILPEVVTGEVKKGAAPVDKRVAKVWAQACAQMIGMLAGMTVKRGRTDAAVNELMSQAKNAAERYVSISGGGSDTGARTAPPVDIEKVRTEAAHKERLSVIKDLELQAENTTNAELKRSLVNLAEMMRKDMEQGKAA